MADTDQPAPETASPPPIVSPTVADLLAASGGRLIRGDMGRWSYPGAVLSVADFHVAAAIEAGIAFPAQVDRQGVPMAITAEPGPVT